MELPNETVVLPGHFSNPAQANEEPLPTFPPQYVDIKRVNAGLLHPDEEKASELELGRNICALSHAYTEEK